MLRQAKKAANASVASAHTHARAMAYSSRNVVVVGGVAGGATFAARLRRLDEHARITVLERGSDIAFA